MARRNINKVLGYGRVSTEDQQDNYSLAAQRSAFTSECKRNDWQGTFLEEVGSGTSISKRPILNNVLDEIKTGKYYGLWLKEQDRLTRPERLGDLDIIIDTLAETDTRLIIGSQEYDLNDDAGDFLFGMNGLFARHFRRQLLRNMKRGKDQKAHEGRKTGSADIYGYKTDEKGRYSIDEKQARIVRLIFSLADEGLSIRRIIDDLLKRGIPSPLGRERWGHGTVAGMLRNEMYIGIFKAGQWGFKKNERGLVVKSKSEARIIQGTREKPNHDPIISPTLFDRVGKRLELRQRNQNVRVHMATGLLCCPKCGKTCSVSSNGSRLQCYRCRDKCGGPWMPVEQYDVILWENFKKLLAKPQNLRRWLIQPVEDPTIELKDLEKSLTQATAKREKLLDLYLNDGLSRDIYTRKNEAIHREIRGLTAEIASLKKRIIAPTTLKGLEEVLRQLGQSSWKWTKEQKMKVFRSIVQSVQLEDENVLISVYLIPVTSLFENRRKTVRAIKLARTIADLSGTDAIAEEHIAEAIQYRVLDREETL